MEINLFVNWYKPENLDRQKELLFCLVRNLSNEYINQIFLFGSDLPEINNPKLKLIPSERLTFSQLFQLMNYYRIDKNTISILSNADIYFDYSLKSLFIRRFYNSVYCLSRYDIINKNLDVKFINRNDSQDSWIFQGKIKKITADFFMGIRGADNKIAYLLKSNGYRVLNPSLTIRSFHYHLSNHRSADYNSNIISQPYLRIKPTRL
jgi:hypothetical protein